MQSIWFMSFKQLLGIVGSRLSEQWLHNLQMVLNYMKLGRWMYQHNFQFSRLVRDHNDVFDAVIEQVRNQRVLYLEFGVYQGAYMRYWSYKLTHPDAKLHGFDSFEGLPEDCDLNGGPFKKGTFSVEGVVPVIDDARVHIFKGWFNEVLPSYSVPEHETLVINNDSDLYSSTIYVLRYLRPWIRAGTFLYFDDMSRVDHQPRAFDEFMRESGLKFSPLCATKSVSLNYVFSAARRRDIRPIMLMWIIASLDFGLRS